MLNDGVLSEYPEMNTHIHRHTPPKAWEGGQASHQDSELKASTPQGEGEIGKVEKAGSWD